MLRAATRQKDALHRLRRPSERLALPWLCPAVLRLQSQSSASASLATSSSTTTKERSRRPSFQSRRSLATAADPSTVEQSRYNPFESSQYSVGGSSEGSNHWVPPAFVAPGEFDASSIVIVEDLLQTQPRVLRKIKGIGGDAEEMMANLDVSLKIGRFDRASALIHRLGQFFPSGSPEYLDIHNRYLQSVVSHMIFTRQNDMVLPVQRWFEVDMPKGGVTPDATTYASMIRMALRMLHGPKRDRTVRRYWEMAKNAEIEEEVLAVPVLSELELGELSEICSSDLQRVAIGSMDFGSAKEPAVAEDEPAAIRQTKQQGYGLTSLHDSLSLFQGKTSVPMPADLDPNDPEQMKYYQQMRERQLEADAVRSAVQRWQQEMEDMKKLGISTATQGSRLRSILSQWHADLVKAIHKELEMVEQAEANPTRTVKQRERCEYGVYLRLLSAEKLAAIAILGSMSVFSRAGVEKGIKTTSLVTTIGKDIRDEMLAERVMEKDAQADTRRRKILVEILAKRKQKTGRSRWKALVRQLEETTPAVMWPVRVEAKVGAVLMSLLVEVAKAPVEMERPETKERVISMHPAFSHSYRVSRGRRIGLINLHPEIIKKVTEEPPVDLISRLLPMVSEPKPWKGPKDGGYITYNTSMMRATPGDYWQPAYLKAAIENHGLEQLRSGLDVLGKTPWIINRDVFNVMLEAWNSGDAVANIAPLDPNFPLPPRPSPDEGPEAEAKWSYEVRELENKLAGFHSNRCFQNFQMEIARAYRNETFYLPHNIDFRGRAYPLPPYLNQMGADNARGLLLFAKGKVLGEGGLRWLKIHLANLFGYDKASLKEREEFTMQHLDDVLDSANNGLHGKRWWLEAEDPWQCLAACCELRNALKLADPTQYESRLPVHQDGSCNGLQHYAALGGDVVGAQQVNLEPSDRPSDVYTGVAEFVKAEVAKEAAEGVEIAKKLNGKITRKIVKQTVMTNVYGVTFIGATRQVRKQLIDYYPEFSKAEYKDASIYIAKKIFQALGSMFTGAHKIQYWLGDCATRITSSLSPEQIEQLAQKTQTEPEMELLSKDQEKKRAKAADPASHFRSTVIWTTPLGLPVVQPYRVKKSRRIATTLQDLSIADASSHDVVSKRKQLQAFPPNFIHSLDATHMMMSALECHRQGLTFSAVHDSFWTHASDVDVMSRILRDAFVRMHSDDIVKRLHAEFQARYGNHIFLTKVDRKSPVGKAVSQLRRENKMPAKQAKLNELFAEYKRQTLLKSDDPELQQQGREMITPASIFEEMGAKDEHLEQASSLGESAVGHVPSDLTASSKTKNIMETDPALESMLSEVDPMSTELLYESSDADSDSVDFSDADTSETRRRQKGPSYEWLWLPMRFKEVPEKGSWDISRLKDSTYFFS
ncbi:hypothetical protein DTO164E3_5059 [Paecilomyces variotii]|nr:hypothetical protein DTO164E3_5059 [Paecilomyces variotii]KAJ9406114.1 hypothetical protein DTO045G8_6222 [Paecilomyces variotii]